MPVKGSRGPGFQSSKVPGLAVPILRCAKAFKSPTGRSTVVQNCSRVVGVVDVVKVVGVVDVVKGVRVVNIVRVGSERH